MGRDSYVAHTRAPIRLARSARWAQAVTDTVGPLARLPDSRRVLMDRTVLVGLPL